MNYWDIIGNQNIEWHFDDNINWFDTRNILYVDFKGDWAPLLVVSATKYDSIEQFNFWRNFYNSDDKEKLCYAYIDDDVANKIFKYRTQTFDFASYPDLDALYIEDKFGDYATIDMMKYLIENYRNDPDLIDALDWCVKSLIC